MNTRVQECRACNGYGRLSLRPDRACDYCDGNGVTFCNVDRDLTPDEQAYIQELIDNGTLEKDWNE